MTISQAPGGPAVRLVSAADAEAFGRDGAVCVRGLLDANWLACLAELFEALVAKGQDMSGNYSEGGPPPPGKTVVTINGWRMNGAFLAAIGESPLPRAAAQLLDSSYIRLYEDLLIFKSAGAEQPTPWHQDEPQWPVSGRRMASGWFCLDPVTTETGALRFALRSHLGPMYRPYVPPERAADVEADARFFTGGDLPDIDSEPERFPVGSFDVTPGDVVFFHPRMVHAAIGSAPTYPRRTLSIRFLGDDVRFLPKKSTFYDFSTVSLQEGDPLSGEEFPLLWGEPVA